MLYLILVAITIKLLHQMFFFLYLFQLKEYRLDRLKEHAKRVYKTRFNTWFHLTIGAPIDSIINKLPKPSLKAGLIGGISLAIVGIFFLIEPTLVFMALFFSPSIILFAWFIILPFEHICKISLFTRAKNKIHLYKKNHKLTVIGITGSYGKTTVKTFITAILQKKYSVVTTPTSINTPVGIARVILNNVKPTHTFFIVEMGAYKRGEIAELCHIAQPDIGILTGISDQHLALFGSQKNIIHAKSELIRALPENGLAIINKESEHQPFLHKIKVKEIIYYRKNQLPKSVRKLKLPSTAYNNLTPAIILGARYGITIGEMIKTLQDTQLPITSLNIIQRGKTRTIIDDTSNANTKGVLEAYRILKSQHNKTKIIIMPCLIELGGNGTHFHKEIAKKFSTSINYVIFTTRDYENEIRKGWGSTTKNQLIFIENPDNVIVYIQPFLTDDYAILLEGRINNKITKFVLSNNQ